MWWKIAAALGLFALVSVVLAYVLAREEPRRLPRPTSQATPVLEATRVSPSLGEGRVLEAEPSHLVEVSWDVRNAGAGPALGLKVRTACSCSVKQALPTTLHAGESERLTVSLRAPQAGLTRREVPIQSGTQRTPLLTLTVPIRAPVNAPSWLEPPGAVYMTGVAGEPFEQELLCGAVERPSEPAWVRHVRLERDDKAGVKFQVDERPYGEDGRFCRRQYRITFRARTNTAGVRRGLLVFEAESDRPTPGAFPWTLRILPPLAMIPGNITFGSPSGNSEKAALVTVVSRLSEPHTVRAEFDETVLDVAPLLVEVSAWRKCWWSSESWESCSHFSFRPCRQSGSVPGQRVARTVSGSWRWRRRITGRFT